jgi:polysaccharide biosynthesis protein PslH
MTTPIRDLLYLTPIAPAATGNGLAMRGFLFVMAASADFNVQILLVPVAGQPPMAASMPMTVLRLPDSRQAAAAVTALMGDPVWRERLSMAYPLPPPATLAPATLATEALRALQPRPGAAVHVARSYLMPLGVALADRIGAAWITADLDDDDEEMARSAGHHAEAAAYGRLIGVFGPRFAGLAVAAPAEAAAISARHGLATTWIPNAVPMPDDRCTSNHGAGDHGAGDHGAGDHGDAGRPARSLLFVGNLTYWPNADAAIRLVREVLPRLRGLTAEPVTVTLVGDPGPDPELRALARQPGVRMAGFAADLAPYYQAADAVVVPLALAAGTRIKLLEAFAHGVPVVTTSQGAAGLELTDGVQALIADSPAGLASGVTRLLADPELRARLAGNARLLVRAGYSHEAVAPRVRAFFRAAANAGPGTARRGPARLRQRA